MLSPMNALDRAYNDMQRALAAERWRMARRLRDRGLTLAEIGVVLGVSRERVRQMLKQLADIEPAGNNNGKG